MLDQEQIAEFLDRLEKANNRIDALRRQVEDARLSCRAEIERLTRLHIELDRSEADNLWLWEKAIDAGWTAPPELDDGENPCDFLDDFDENP